MNLFTLRKQSHETKEETVRIAEKAPCVVVRRHCRFSFWYNTDENSKKWNTSCNSHPHLPLIWFQPKIKLQYKNQHRSSEPRYLSLPYLPRQRSRFVCLCVCVCLFVSTLTAEWFNIWSRNLVPGLTLIIPQMSLLVKVIGQRSRSQGQKNIVSRIFWFEWTKSWPMV